MTASERQPITVEGIIAHHKATISNPLGELKEKGVENSKVTLQITTSKGSADQPYAHVPQRAYTASGDPAQTMYSKLLMRDLIRIGTPVEITYDPDQPVPRGGEGWVMDSISVPGENGDGRVLLDLKAKTNGHHE